jgi:hypothetical protein
VLVGGRVTGADDVGCGPFRARTDTRTTAFIAAFNASGICQWQWLGTTPSLDYVWRLFRGSGRRVVAWAGQMPPGVLPFLGPSRLLEVGAGGAMTELPVQGAPESWDEVAVDRHDRVSLVGVTEGFERGADSPRGFDLVRLLPSGDAEWKVHLCDGTRLHGMWLEADPNGDLGLLASFTGTLQLGGETFQARGATDMFMVKVSGTDGRVLWKHVFGTAADESQDLGLVADEQGSWYAVGEHGGVDFGQGALTPSVFVVKWSAAGEVLWSKGFGGTSRRDAARRVVIDRDGNPLVFGRLLSPSVAFDGRTVENAEGSDLYLARLDAKSGAVLAVKTWPAVDAPARALSIDVASGNVALGGRFNHQLSLGQGRFSAKGEDGYFGSVGAVP